MSDFPMGVDVIVRLHDPNRLLEFETALFSLLNQSFKPVHPIVVTQSFDAEATSRVQAAIDTLDWTERGHHCPTVLNVDAPPGQDIRAKLLNAGISRVRTRFLAFLDGDDYLYGHAYRHLVDRALASRAVIAFGSIVCKHVKVFNEFVYTSKTLKDVFKGNSLKDLLTQNFCPIHSFVVDRARVSPNDLTFNPELSRLEDYDFLLRLCSQYPAAFEGLDVVVGVYNWHLDGRGTIEFSGVDPVKVKENRQAWNVARRHIWRLKTEFRTRPASSIHPVSQTAVAGAKEPEIPQLFPAGHFYSPVVDPKDLRSRSTALWASSDKLEGIDLNPSGQLALLAELRNYTATIEYPVRDPGDNRTYFYSNDQFPALDAEFLHAALACFRPRVMIEVGSGFSSLVTAKVNRDILEGQLDFSCIEPYPRQFLIDGVDGITRIVRSKVEDVDLVFFDRLGAGDVLFIDSSHVSKTGSDVNYLIFEVLPRLKSGVLVHFHDIFLPDEYPQEWVLDDGRNWNEQYLLRAFLQFNTDFSVVWAANYMGTRQTAAVRTTFPHYPELGGGGSFWIRKVG
jgi:hypothetical protein